MWIPRREEDACQISRSLRTRSPLRLRRRPLGRALLGVECRRRCRICLRRCWAATSTPPWRRCGRRTPATCPGRCASTRPGRRSASSTRVCLPWSSGLLGPTRRSARWWTDASWRRKRRSRGCCAPAATSRRAPAVQAATDALATSNAQAEAAAARSALAGASDELDAARTRAEAEAASGRAAREELRLVRRELHRAERQIEALTERCRDLEGDVRRAEAAVQAARQQAVDEQRRLNGRLAELQAHLTETQRQYRTLRRASVQIDPVVAEAVGALERDLATLRRAVGLPDPGRKRSGGPAAPGQPRQPERRTPLPVPGGRGADDPETLAAWMSVPEVLVLVDGYNVTKHERGFPEKSLEDQRTLLVDLCRRMARRWGAQITVVFDGANVAPVPTRLPLGAVDVVFTDPGRTADDEIVARVNAAPPERPVVVVSSDNELRQRSAALGASVTRATALLGLASR